MIKNIWSKISIYCGNHDHPVKMEPHEPSTYSKWSGGNNSMFYSCPKYYPDNRIEGEKPCFNHLSMAEYEDMVMHISGLIEEAGLDSQVDLTGLKWINKKGTEFEIMEQDMDHIRVKFINNRAIKR